MTPRIVLIGAPGSGKSTIGKELAKLLALSFSDTDLMIEAREQKSISDIFVDKGEPFFREIEQEVLKDALSLNDCVLSLGGGAPISENAQKLIVESGATVVFLDISLASAAPRIGFNRDRPLLLGNPRAQWSELLELRRPVYEKISSIKIDANVGTPSEIAHTIMKEIA